MHPTCSWSFMPFRRTAPALREERWNPTFRLRERSRGARGSAPGAGPLEQLSPYVRDRRQASDDADDLVDRGKGGLPVVAHAKPPEYLSTAPPTSWLAPRVEASGSSVMGG
jgi:hypothetical protein